MALSCFMKVSMQKANPTLPLTRRISDLIEEGPSFHQPAQVSSPLMLSGRGVAKSMTGDVQFTFFSIRFDSMTQLMA